MNIALPECDGPGDFGAISFKENHRYVPDPERMQRVAILAHASQYCGSKSNAESG